ncbi:LamG-like jellyroll fold domain-containing protein [Sorangium sp. So ce1014]|uniref:LamG-like jellyroll fold domain-containing protein n=1 Tax=Sorangium sp. So ce1014 TaxID=3133326 RepID=UPI003F607291
MIRRSIARSIADPLEGYRSEGFTPALLPGLVHWFRADRGVTLSDEKVALWRSFGVGGGDAVQASGSAQPTWTATGLGGKPSLLFDGSLTFMTASSPSTLTTRTYGFAFSATKVTQNRLFDTQTTTYPLLGLCFDGTRPLLMAGSSNYRYFTGSSKQSDGQLHACVTTVPGVALNDITNATVEIDGQTLAPSTAATATGPVTSPGALVLGGSSGGATRFGGHLGEFVVFNRVLLPAETAQLVSYLLAR